MMVGRLDLDVGRRNNVAPYADARASKRPPFEPMDRLLLNDALFSSFAPSDGSADHASRTPSEASTAPATNPATPPQPTATRGARGGVPGPGPAVGGEIDETPVVTHHSITVRGKTLNYTATVAQMPLKNSCRRNRGAHFLHGLHARWHDRLRRSGRSLSASTVGRARRPCGCTWEVWARAVRG